MVLAPFPLRSVLVKRVHASVIWSKIYIIASLHRFDIGQPGSHSHQICPTTRETGLRRFLSFFRAWALSMMMLMILFLDAWIGYFRVKMLIRLMALAGFALFWSCNLEMSSPLKRFVCVRKPDCLFCGVCSREG